MSGFEDVAAFPLCWPEGWPRTDRHKRKNGQFDRITKAIETARSEN